MTTHAPSRIRRLFAAWSRARGVGLVLALVAAAHVTGGGLRAETVAEPADYRTSDYRSPVPATLQGARVVTAAEAKSLHDGKGAVFIDVYPRPPKPPNLPAGTVWRDPKHASIEGAHWLPNVGYGILAPEPAAYLAARLEQLTGGDKARPLVFFCLKDCWMSWNAARRALVMGYTSVVWFPDGTDGWQALGLALAEVQPVP